MGRRVHRLPDRPGRRTLCRGWADLLEAGLGCSQALADLLVRAEILDRADRDLEGTADPRALVTGMTEVVADVRADLLELALLEPGQLDLARLLDQQAALLGLVREYAGVEDTSMPGTGVPGTG